MAAPTRATRYVRLGTLLAALRVGSAAASLACHKAGEPTVPPNEGGPTAPPNGGGPAVPPTRIVRVTPETASVAAGSPVQLRAVVLDERNQVIPSAEISWSSASSSGASVSGSGLVCGVSTGTTVITASSGSASASASVTVRVAPTLPAGTFVRETFDDECLGARGWYDNTSVPRDASNRGSTAADSAGYWHFARGATIADRGGAMRRVFPATNTVYLSYSVRHSVNWIGSGKPYHPHEFHILSTMDGEYDGLSQSWLSVYVEETYDGGGKPRVSIQDSKAINTVLGLLPLNLIGITESRSTGGCNGVVELNMTVECFNAPPWTNDKQVIGPVAFQADPGPGYKGDWNHVEVYLQLNSVVAGIGLADGVLQYWLNGALLIDRHDVCFRTGARAELRLNKLVIAPYIGDGSPVDQSIWVDNLTIAAQRVTTP